MQARDESESCLSYHWDADLTGADVHVWTDDRPGSKVHSFPHHVLPE